MKALFFLFLTSVCVSFFAGCDTSSSEKPSPDSDIVSRQDETVESDEIVDQDEVIDDDVQTTDDSVEQDEGVDDDIQTETDETVDEDDVADFCASNPCQNNATCNNLSTSYKCECLPGFSGTNCEDYNAFITVWKTDNEGSSASTEITIPTNGTDYDYSVDCDGDGTFELFNIHGDYTCSYAEAGTYTVKIVGDFPRIYFNPSGDKLKIVDIQQWGDIVWKSMDRAFYGCSNLNISASDAPNLSQVTSLTYMFFNNTSLDANLNNWDVSNVIDMSSVFYGASSFNQPLSSWNVSKVTNMNSMFYGTSSFNQPLPSWKVSNVTDMGGMFDSAVLFNQPLDSWDVSNVTNMRRMFYGAKSFN